MGNTLYTASTKLITNPYLRFSWGNSSNAGETTVEDFFRGRRFIVRDIRLIQLLLYLSNGRTFRSLKKHWNKTLGYKEAELALQLTELTEKQLILLSGTSSHKTDNSYLWEKYNWSSALFYHLASTYASYVDKDSPIADDIREATVKSYLEVSAPQFYKKYPHEQKIALEKADALLEEPTLISTLLNRRTYRGPKNREISIKQLSAILANSTSEARKLRDTALQTYQSNPNVLLRSHLSPFEVYIIANKVNDLERGIYHYDISAHSLDPIAIGDFRKSGPMIGIGQHAAYGSVVILISAVFERYMWRYRHPRAFRLLLANVAELAQSFLLVATSFDLRTFLTPAIRDTYTSELLGIEPFTEDVLYLLSIG